MENKKIYEFEVFKGILLANISAFVLIGITKYLKPDSTVLIYSEFVIIPLLMGVISAWGWRDLRLSTGKILNFSLINEGLAILLSAVFLHEGVICLIIVSPLILAFLLIGAYGGAAMFRRKNGTLNVSILSVLFLLFTIDSFSVHNYENLVTDQVLIKAPAKEVWKYVPAFRKIEAKSSFWLFKVGLPEPVAASVEGYYEGAGRKCIFSNGYVFDERISSFHPEKELTFEITNQPADPEIMGHINILKGQFILKDNGNGTTTLVGNSWYSLNVFPVWYYDLWAESITRNVHLKVMEHIKQLSEREGGR